MSRREAMNMGCEARHSRTALVLALIVAFVSASRTSSSARALSYSIDLGGATTPFPHVWEECVGSGHAALSLRADWRAALTRAHTELGFKRVRFHGVFNDDMNVMLPTGVSFFNIDSTYDFLFSLGMAPFVELGFSPAAIATGNATIFHYKGIISPPQLDSWSQLVSSFASHLTDRYGADATEALWFEVWNEYNCGFLEAADPRLAYYAIYNATALALKGVNPKLRVGGPVTCQSADIPAFLTFASKNSIPVDFVSTHIYPTDPAVKLGQIYPILNDTANRVRNSPFPNVPLIYSEFNDGLFGTPPFHDMPFAATWMVRTMAELDAGDCVFGCFFFLMFDLRSVVPFLSWWTFSDVFEEAGMAAQEFDKPTTTGWGLLSASGIAKPVYRAFQLLHQAGDLRLAVVPMGGETQSPDVGILALTGKENALHLLLFNSHWPTDVAPAVNASFTLRLSNGGKDMVFNATRVDDSNANAPQVWRNEGRPLYLKPADVARYNAASELQFELVKCRAVSDNECEISNLHVPVNGLLVLVSE